MIAQPKALLLALLAGGLALSASPAEARVCGEPPLDGPVIPDGAKADVDAMQQARDELLSYSESVDAYLSCMDERSSDLLPYLSKEQQNRWREDLNRLHETRRDLQISFNEEIREYRRLQQKK
ncbi:hypothetical protein [Yunchengibacter salinarum]|uniref:hypothetical protein n=1 Tax=Yunchengibacter salinarum TaxID=3133399 RepID=UPI0035B67EEE